MRILAIDPGNEQSAWCELDDGNVMQSGMCTNQNLLLRRLYTCLRPSPVLAVEMIASYGMPVGREVFETCLWVGRFVEAWDSRGGNVQLIYRKDVKMHLCHSMRATDANIRAALIDRYGPGKQKAIGLKASPGPLYGIKGDEWAALAVAVTVHDTSKPFDAARARMAVMFGDTPAEKCPF